jgi:predicted RNase H-like HicB family nuclease
MRYAVVIEKAKRNYSAYIPDVPGCVATGKTVQETLTNLRDALDYHFEGMREDGDRIPDPETLVDYVDVTLPSIQSEQQPTTSRKLSARQTA